jgi:hypothetical protein
MDWSPHMNHPRDIIITKDMVGKTIIKAFGKSWWLRNAIGAIQDIDVGKKLRLGKHPDYVIQMESDEQYNKRMTPMSVKYIKEKL